MEIGADHVTVDEMVTAEAILHAVVSRISALGSDLLHKKAPIGESK